MAGFVASGVGSAVLGLAFWVLAARLVPADQLGLNSSVVSAMMTAGGVAQINFSRSLAAVLPAAGATAWKKLTFVYGITTGIAVLVALVWVIVAPALSRDFRDFHESPLLLSSFVVSVPLWVIFTLQDSALATVRAVYIVALENCFYGVLKLLALAALVNLHVGRYAVLLAWVLPLPFLIAPVTLLLRRKLLDVPSVPQSWPAAEGGRAWLHWDLIGYFCWLASSLPIPILAVALVGPAATAVLYLPLLIASTVDLLLLQVGNLATTDVVRGQGAVDRRLQKTLLSFLLLVAGGSAAVALGARVILRGFGAQYAFDGTVVLRYLMLAVGARALLIFLLALARGRRWGQRIAVVQATYASLVLIAGGAALAQLGVRAFAAVVLIANFVTALVACKVILLPLLRSNHA